MKRTAQSAKDNDSWSSIRFKREHAHIKSTSQPSRANSFDAAAKIVCCEIECIQDTSEGEWELTILWSSLIAPSFSLNPPFYWVETPFAPFFLSSQKHIVWRGVLQRAEQAQSDYEFPLFHCLKKTHNEPHFLPLSLSLLSSLSFVHFLYPGARLIATNKQ